MNRRETLRLLGAGGASVLAGCTGGKPTESSTADESAKRITGRWEMVGFDPSNSGYAPDESGPVSSPAPLWETTTGSDARLMKSGIGGAPAIRDGTLYIGGSDGTVRAMDATTGEHVWQNTTNFYIGSSPAIGDKQLFVGAGDNHVHAFDLESGDRNWKRNLRSSVDASVIYTGDLVVSYPAYGPLTAVDPRDGKIVWQYDDGNGYMTAVSDGTAYVPTSASDCGIWTGCETTGGVNVVDVETGEKTGYCKLSTGTSPTSEPTLDDQHLYLTAADGIVYAVSLTSHEVVWKAKMESTVGTVPTVSDVLITGDTDGIVYGFETQSGSERSRFEAGASLTGTCVASDTLYVGAKRGSDGVVHALDPSSGDKLWSYELKEPATTNPVVVDGALCIGDKGGSLHVLVDESVRDEYESAGNTTTAD